MHRFKTKESFPLDSLAKILSVVKVLLDGVVILAVTLLAIIIVNAKLTHRTKRY